MAEAEGSTPFVSTLGFDKPLTLCRRLFLKRKGNTMAELESQPLSAEERAEFEAEEPGSSEREMEFGDLLFALVNVARKEGIDAESALRASTAKFRRRWAAMEQMAADAHVNLAELSTHGLNDLWDAAKAGE